MNKRGLAKRRMGARSCRADPTDRRRMVLELTPEGHSVADRLLNGITAVNGQILAPLGPEEQEQFRSLLKRII